MSRSNERQLRDVENPFYGVKTAGKVHSPQDPRPRCIEDVSA